MTNFKPMKDYLFFLFNRLNSQYNFKSPFLDAGAGIGDTSLFLAKKGFYGEAVDISKDALKIAKETLKGYNVKVMFKDAEKINKKYNLIISLDLLEHIQKDELFFSKLAKNLKKGGYILLTLPYNPKEWGWDDEFYGHIRRYSKRKLISLFKKNNIEIKEFWDVTFPFFWILRRLSLKLLKPKNKREPKKELTKKSTLQQYWDIGVFSKLINNCPLWRYLFNLQFSFRNKERSHEVMILGIKNG